MSNLLKIHKRIQNEAVMKGRTPRTFDFYGYSEKTIEAKDGGMPKTFGMTEQYKNPARKTRPTSKKSRRKITKIKKDWEDGKWKKG